MKISFQGIKRASIATALMVFAFVFHGVAQTTTSAAPATNNSEVGSNYDPIAAMLDSLVTLNYVQRLNFASATNQQGFQPYEIPTYTDDVYAKRISKIQSPIPLVFNQQVKEYIDLYAVRKR